MEVTGLHIPATNLCSPVFTQLSQTVANLPRSLPQPLWQPRRAEYLCFAQTQKHTASLPGQLRPFPGLGSLKDNGRKPDLSHQGLASVTVQPRAWPGHLKMLARSVILLSYLFRETETQRELAKEMKCVA